MTKFIIRRVIFAIFIIFFGCLIVYGVMRCMPSTFVETTARQLSTLPGAKSYDVLLKQLEEKYGFDKPIVLGYLQWCSQAIRGEFGDSWKFNQPVIQKFNSVIWYSVVINILTYILQTVLCIPLGILAARKQYSKTDYTVTVIALMGISLPSFFLATLLKYVFSIKLGWFDLYGLVGRNHEILSDFGKFMDIAHHMVLPIITLMILSIGGLMRYTRTNMLEVLNADYIRTARAKGLPERVVINRHAFRNTLIPLISYMSYVIPNMFGGAMITETLFQIPGIGYSSYLATISGDIPFTLFYIAFLEILTQVSLLLADIMYAAVDPRVRVN